MLGNCHTVRLCEILLLFLPLNLVMQKGTQRLKPAKCEANGTKKGLADDLT